MDDGNVPRESESYWKDDHREMLSRSHKRTKKYLDTSGDLDVSEEPAASHRDPQDQILPSPKVMQEEVEGAKKRAKEMKTGRKRTGESSPTMPNKSQSIKPVADTVAGDDGFLTLSCRSVVMWSLTIFGIIGIIALIILSPLLDSMESNFQGFRGPQETNKTHISMEEAKRVSRHDLQLSIFGGLGTRQKSSLPVFEGKISPSYYPLHDTLPVFWIIPYSGDTTTMDVLSYCKHLTLANQKSSFLDTNEDVLEIVTYSDKVAHYVNIDTTTIFGLERADRMGLVESHMADVIATSLVPLVAELFTHKLNTGRLFSVIRHPVHRAVAEFIQRKDLSPQHSDYIPGLSNLQLYQYVQSGFVDENIMVRSLANVTRPNLITEDHVEIAKKVLEHYVVVGLSHRLEESMDRFYNYFGWDGWDGDWELCQANFMAMREILREEIVSPGSDEYDTLLDRNWADMQLFEHAQYVFDKQAKLKPKMNRRRE